MVSESTVSRGQCIKKEFTYFPVSPWIVISSLSSQHQFCEEGVPAFPLQVSRPPTFLPYSLRLISPTRYAECAKTYAINHIIMKASAHHSLSCAHVYTLLAWRRLHSLTAHGWFSRYVSRTWQVETATACL